MPMHLDTVRTSAAKLSRSSVIRAPSQPGQKRLKSRLDYAGMYFVSIEAYPEELSHGGAPQPSTSSSTSPKDLILSVFC